MRSLSLLFVLVAACEPIVEDDIYLPVPDAQLVCDTPITILAPRPDLHYATDLAVIATMPWENVAIFALDDIGGGANPLDVPTAQTDPDSQELTLTWQFTLQPSRRYTLTINGPEDTGCTASVEFFTSAD